MEESDAFHALIEEYEKLSDEEFYGIFRKRIMVRGGYCCLKPSRKP